MRNRCLFPPANSIWSGRGASFTIRRDTGRIVREIERVLRPGGEARLMVYNLEGMPAYITLRDAAICWAFGAGILSTRRFGVRPTDFRRAFTPRDEFAIYWRRSSIMSRRTFSARMPTWYRCRIFFGSKFFELIPLSRQRRLAQSPWRVFICGRNKVRVIGWGRRLTARVRSPHTDCAALCTVPCGGKRRHLRRCANDRIGLAAVAAKSRHWHVRIRPTIGSSMIAVRAFANRRLAFLLANMAASQRAARVVYDFAGTARAHIELPFRGRPYAVWVHGWEVWGASSPKYLRAIAGARLVLANSAYTVARADGAFPKGLEVVACPLATRQEMRPRNLGQQTARQPSCCWDEPMSCSPKAMTF